MVQDARSVSLIFPRRAVEGEGKAGQVNGNLKQAGEKVKDAFKK
jgi:hypothetical protein